jgi:flagellar assembly factor FliW
VKISTTRFGDIIIDESKVIRMKGGILGFEQLKRYALFIQGEKIPFWWFQSVEDGSIAFVVIDSLTVNPDFKPLIPETEVKLLEIGSPEEAVLLSVVTIHSNQFKVTANLRAPIVVNVKKKLAKQVILVDSKYSVQYPVTGGSTVVEGKEKAGISPLVLAL